MIFAPVYSFGMWVALGVMFRAWLLPPLARRFTARDCQYCDNVINGWRAGLGVYNCPDCSHRMQMGQRPRCRKSWCPEQDGYHGHAG